jgi:hypothetical protein
MGIGKLMGNAQRLWVILKGYKKAAGKFPNTSHQPIGEKAELPRGCRQKHGNYC